MMQPSVISKSQTYVLLACGALILSIAMGVRHTSGLFLAPMISAHSWAREDFALAIALQNLIWGVGQPFAGMLADRWGARRIIVGGSLLYVLGLVCMAYAQHISFFTLGAGLFVGLGLSGTTFGVVLGAVVRNTDVAKRSIAMGIATAGGSFGQFIMLPIGQGAIDAWGWQMAIWVLSCIACAMLPLALGVKDHPQPQSLKTETGLPNLTVRAALREALQDQNFHLLFWSFFVCGFHTAFIVLHMPAFIRDAGFSGNLGMKVLALIGLFNIAGSFASGWLGGKLSKRMLLAWIYLARGVVILGLLFLPLTPFTLYAFGVAMGILWLGTVPLTNGLVAQIFGVQYVSMLSGVVFLGHQLGSFLGAWLGGYLADQFHSYTIAWWVAFGLALLAAILVFPIREQSIVRSAAG